jgi:hypothetical protein
MQTENVFRLIVSAQMASLRRKALNFGSDVHLSYGTESTNSIFMIMAKLLAVSLYRVLHGFNNSIYTGGHYLTAFLHLRNEKFCQTANQQCESA